jgi:hypothetical protein
MIEKERIIPRIILILQEKTEMNKLYQTLRYKSKDRKAS